MSLEWAWQLFTLKSIVKITILPLAFILDNLPKVMLVSLKCI